MKLTKLGLFIIVLTFISCITNEDRERRDYYYQVTYDILYPDSARRFVGNTFVGKAEVLLDRHKNYCLWDEASFMVDRSAYPIVIINQIKKKRNKE
jgi:hypothetical protein